MSTCSTPSVVMKMELSLHSLMHGQNAPMKGSLSTPSDLSDPYSYHHHHHSQYLDHNDQYNSISSPESSVDACSPTFQQQYFPEQQYLSANEYSSAFQTQQVYQVAFALILQQHARVPTPQASQSSDLTSSSPVLSQSQIFRKQIQQEHHRFQQEQYKSLPDALMASNLDGAASSAPLAVPSMHTVHSQIPTPTSANPLSASLSAMSSLLGHDDDHHNHQQQRGSMEDKAHYHLSSVVELVAVLEL